MSSILKSKRSDGGSNNINKENNDDNNNINRNHRLGESCRIVDVDKSDLYASGKNVNNNNVQNNNYHHHHRNGDYLNNDVSSNVSASIISDGIKICAGRPLQLGHIFTKLGGNKPAATARHRGKNSNLPAGQRFATVTARSARLADDSGRPFVATAAAQSTTTRLSGSDIFSNTNTTTTVTPATIAQSAPRMVGTIGNLTTTTSNINKNDNNNNNKGDNDNNNSNSKNNSNGNNSSDSNNNYKSNTNSTIKDNISNDTSNITNAANNVITITTSSNNNIRDNTNNMDDNDNTKTTNSTTNNNSINTTNIISNNINNNHANLANDVNDGHTHEDDDGDPNTRYIGYVGTPTFSAGREIIYIEPADVLIAATWILFIALIFALLQYFKSFTGGNYSRENRMAPMPGGAAWHRGRSPQSRRRRR